MSSDKKETNKEIEYISQFTRTIVDVHDLDNILEKGSNHGVCGGHNLGNTCFMNSSIACLSNCTELTAYFLSGKYKVQINKNNPEGLQGDLANAWHDMLEQYWNSNVRTGDPGNVKYQVSRKVRKFGGFGQQDSNEFMTEFLSILNEDLNRTSTKKYVELKEKGENEEEIECAKRFFNHHQQLNDSIITDLFSGLLRSEVQCPKCNYKSITFDPFNTLTLPIPSKNEMYEQIQLFYIPKYGIRKSCKINVYSSLSSKLKDNYEDIKSIEEFPYKYNNLKLIKVKDSQLERFVDENEKYQKNDFIFAFDDETKEGVNTKTIPLYMYKDKKISAFPRLLQVEENMTYGQLKKKIYIFARQFFTNPLKESKVDEQIDEYKTTDDLDKFDEEKLFNMIELEYEEIFEKKSEQNKEEIDTFINNLPYKIEIKNKYDDEIGLCLFDGKDNLDNLKEFEISKDDDSIKNIVNKIENEKYLLNLILSTNSKFTITKFNLNTCESYEGPRKSTKHDLDSLLTYFCTKEYLGRGNEWHCKNCNKNVEASKYLSIFYVPRILVICLSRFSKRGYGYNKNDEYINFPVEGLNMGKYLCGPDKDHSVYDLFAVSQHFGGCGGGHYTATCKNYDGKWYDYNDSSCSSSSANSAVSSSAYVLFYRRRNW